MDNYFSNTSIATRADDTQVAGAASIVLRFVGLRPNSKHRVYIEGEDYTWACKGWGKNLGEELVTNEFGSVCFSILYEISMGAPFEREDKVTNSVAYYSSRMDSGASKRENNVSRIYKTVEIRSADNASHAREIIFFPVLARRTPANQ
jgi:hypothetical protein